MSLLLYSDSIQKISIYVPAIAITNNMINKAHRSNSHSVNTQEYIIMRTLDDVHTIYNIICM